MTAAASVPTPVHALDNTVSNDFWDTTEYVKAANQIIERVNKVYPDESLEDIVKLYCRSYYGPATGPLMARYFLLMDSNLVKSSHPGTRPPNDDPKDDGYAKNPPQFSVKGRGMPVEQD